MDSYATQSSAFKPFDAPPCPGCAQAAMQAQNVMDQAGMPGYTGMPGMPGMASQPLVANPAVVGQMPTGAPAGPYLGTGQSPQRQLLQGQVPQFPGMSPAPIQPASPTSPLAPIVPWNQPMPVTTESLQYMNGFMRTQIGRKVTIEFLIGTNTLTDKTGTLLAVGANYVLINEIESDDILLADFYSIKFIKFYY